VPLPTISTAGCGSHKCLAALVPHAPSRHAAATEANAASVVESLGPKRDLSQAGRSPKAAHIRSPDTSGGFLSRGSSSFARMGDEERREEGKLFEATALQKSVTLGTVKFTFEYVIDRRSAPGEILAHLCALVL
jgi:hypothetical protein